jgi:hypothetical protein
MKYKLKINEIMALNTNTYFSTCKKFKVKIKKKTIIYLIGGILDGVLVLLFPVISNHILQDKFFLSQKFFFSCVIWSMMILHLHLVLLFPEIYIGKKENKS